MFYVFLKPVQIHLWIQVLTLSNPFTSASSYFSWQRSGPECLITGSLKPLWYGVAEPCHTAPTSSSPHVLLHISGHPATMTALGLCSQHQTSFQLYPFSFSVVCFLSLKNKNNNPQTFTQYFYLAYRFCLFVCLLFVMCSANWEFAGTQMS